MQIVEFRNRIMFLNFDQIGDYPTFDQGGITYLDVGVLIADVIEDGWVVTNMTEISEPDVDAIIVYDAVSHRGKIGIRLSTVEDDLQYAIVVDTHLHNAELGEDQIVKTEVRVNILSGYITCPTDERQAIWAIDFNPSGMQGEVLNDDAIIVSVTDIIMTAYTERPRRPDYGSPLPTTPFSTLDEYKGEDMLDETITQIEKWEQRVVIDKDRASLEIFPSRNALIISLPLFVPSENKKVLYRKLLQE